MFTALHVNPPTTLGRARRTQPNKHFSSRNANIKTFPNRFEKTGVSLVASWVKNADRLQKRFTNKTSQWPYMDPFGDDGSWPREELIQLYDLLNATKENNEESQNKVTKLVTNTIEGRNK